MYEKEIEIYLTGLVYVIMKASEFKIWRAGQQAGDPVKSAEESMKEVTQ